MEVLTSRQMRNIDARAIREFGLPQMVLMENAGAQVASFLRRTYPDLASRRTLILCGPGNNGGDALVLARHLRNAGVPFDVVLLGRRGAVRGAAAAQLDIARRLAIVPREVTSRAAWTAARRLLASAGLVVDGVLGTGLSRPVEGLLATVFADVNAAPAEVVAVDVPSGLSGDEAEVSGPCIAADHTVTFARPKIPHVFPPAEGLCGAVHVVDIGIPPEAVAAEQVDLHLMERAALAPLLPPRRADSHKGDFGHVLIVAGSRGKGGAARMATLGALRAGSGLVTAAVPTGLQMAMVVRAMEAMTEGLSETDSGSPALAAAPRLFALLEGKRVVAAGPGLSTHPETAQLVRDLVARATIPVVLDADGIAAFNGASHLLSGRARPLVLTPHPGEMGRLVGRSTAEVQKRRLPLAREFARDHDCFLVLKGHRTLIATPSGTVHVNPTGNPGMAKGGSGDVLTGILAGLIAQGLQIDNAVRLGVYLHGLAADLAAGEVGQVPLLARDILARFPKALARLRPACEAGGDETVTAARSV